MQNFQTKYLSLSLCAAERCAQLKRSLVYPMTEFHNSAFRFVPWRVFDACALCVRPVCLTFRKNGIYPRLLRMPGKNGGSKIIRILKFYQFTCLCALRIEFSFFNLPLSLMLFSFNFYRFQIKFILLEEFHTSKRSFFELCAPANGLLHRCTLLVRF